MGESLRVNSQQSCDYFCKQVQANFDKHKYTTYGIKHGEERSYDQNALFHLWATEYAAYALKVHTSSVSEGQLEGTKRHLKQACYRENGWEWLVVVISNPETGQEKKDFRSSAKYLMPDMFRFMTWVQTYAMERNCILESKGKYKKLQSAQNS